MVTITLKNIPADLHQQLKKQAKKNRRSLNSEILARLEQAAHQPSADVSSFLHDIRELREKVPGYLTDKKINEYKNKGRA